LEDKLAEVQKSLDNIIDAIEKMGYATHVQQRYDSRKREEEEVLSELAVLKALQVNPRHIGQISDEVLEGWIVYMRDAFLGNDRALSQRIIQHFVAKIVIKEGTGTLYYTFPFPDHLYVLAIP
jgi:DNA-binding MarR family transcriptional regulator